MKEINSFSLYLIRHGQSAVNAIPDMIGQSATTPLTDLGVAQAEQLRDSLKKKNVTFDLVFSSNYIRALDTANIVTADYSTKPIVREEIREYSAGDWAFQSRKAIITPEVQLEMASLTNAFLPPNGESLNQVERRVGKWLEDDILYNQSVKDQSQMTKDLKIGVFSHGMTIKCLLHYIMGFDQSFTWKIDLYNTSVTKLSFGENGWRLNSVNDISHL